jgi:hypothetical protein
MKLTSYVTPHYAVFSSLPPLPLKSKYSQRPVLEHPYKTTGEIMFSYIFFDRRWEDKRLK